MFLKFSGYSQGKSTLKINSNAYEKYEYGHLGYWHIKLTLFKMYFLIGSRFLVSDRAVLNGNDVFSILVVSTKKRYSSFLVKVFVFQKICFKVKVLIMFETFMIVT